MLPKVVVTSRVTRHHPVVMKIFSIQAFEIPNNRTGRYEFGYVPCESDKENREILLLLNTKIVERMLDGLIKF